MKSVKTDCRYFKGGIPCVYHKRYGIKCGSCKYYDKIKERILVIKLGAAGDVIRTTPLLRRIKKQYPHCEISWLTNYPEFTSSYTDNALQFNMENAIWLAAQKFDIIYNLDKAKEACAIAALISSAKKKGFRLKFGKCFPADKDACHKWETGLRDDLNRSNKKSYLEEIFEICGFAFQNEKYILDSREPAAWPGFKHPLVGLNTGSGDQWLSRRWPEREWIKIAKALRRHGYHVLLLGGEREDGANRNIAKAGGVAYPGHFSVGKFVDLVGQCDLVITGVTMALHIAIALEKKIILLNNVFNRNEFDLYGLGKIVEPPVPCLGCYSSSCARRFKGKRCTEMINTDEIIKICRLLLPVSKPKRS